MELILCKIYRHFLLEVEVAAFVAQVVPTPASQSSEQSHESN